jgi:hypothetical protein
LPLSLAVLFVIGPYDGTAKSVERLETFDNSVKNWKGNGLMTSFDRLYEMRGRDIERDISRRNGIIQRLRKYAKRREDQSRATAKLERDFIVLLKEARGLVPPVSTYELERITKVPRSSIIRIMHANGLKGSSRND